MDYQLRIADFGMDAAGGLSMIESMRVDFEAAMIEQLISEGYSAQDASSVMERAPAGWYASIRVNGAWFGWCSAHKHCIGADGRMNIIARNGNGGEHYE